MSVTTVWMIRHAQADANVSDPLRRPLTEAGKKDCALVTDLLRGQGVSRVFSSPYRRAAETVSDFAKEVGLPVQTDDGFCEFHAGKPMPEAEFLRYVEACFRDPAYMKGGGESFEGLQNRVWRALSRILNACSGQSVAVGTHGVALSALIHRFTPSFGYDGFLRVLPRMPLIARMVFAGVECLEIELIDPKDPGAEGMGVVLQR